MSTTNWYNVSAEATLEKLNVNRNQGLDSAEAAARMTQHGPNELTESGVKSPWRILWEQFTATMILLLLGAGVLSLVLGKANEAISIFAIVILFGLLGFIQEYRAEQAINALKKMSVPIVRVRRNGKVQEILAREVTIGEIILLDAGNVVPADLRLIESSTLRIQESTLTGESEPVEKEASNIDATDLPLGDRRNMAYMGTVVTYGRGVGVATAIGMNAELGKIASLLQSVQSEETPLQKRLNSLGTLLAVVGVVVAIIVMAIDLARGVPLRDTLLTAVSVAVAVIPEGLTAVVTFTLALGARRMLERNALIRKLPSVETLGAVTTICSDKTGTLTENRMTVVVLDVAGHRLEVTQPLTNDSPGYQTGEEGSLLRKVESAETTRSLALLLAGGALCNDAEIEMNNGRVQMIGDPTEGALLVAGMLGGMKRVELEQALPRVGELPFDADRKRMTTLHQHLNSSFDDELFHVATPDPSTYISFTKGSVDGLLDIATTIWDNNQVVPLSADYRQRIEEANGRLASNGMRVLGVAFKRFNTLPASNQSQLENDLTFVGFFGIIDPPRPEVKEAVKIAKKAGIRPVMITGDHPLTAQFIAKELGILTEQSSGVMTGVELQKIDDDELEKIVEKIAVFARVSPEHKLRIVKALQKRGNITAMTGDGVNDAPALKQADIGVAMGITGTDVSKEAADMVLRDDNFATIIAAVEEGRTIYDNVRRFVKFSIAGNIAKVGVMLIAPLLGMPTALLPLQLLWLNLMTDGLLGLGIGFEPSDPRVMNRPPLSPKAGIFSNGLGLHATWVGLLLTVLSVGVGYYYWREGLPQWQTVIFTAIAFAQVGQSLASRSNQQSLFKMGLMGNKPLLGLTLLVIIAQITVLVIPGLRTFFKTELLTEIDWLVCIGVGVVMFIAIEIEKLFLHSKS